MLRACLRIVIHEGRNRQVRRMCEVVGYPVRRLIRTRIGPISDTHLEPGEYRELSQKEVRELALAAATRSSGKAGKVGSHPMAMLRAIRGATTVDADLADQITERTQALVAAMLERNGLDIEDLVSLIFTSTPDLHAGFPATAATSARTERGATPRCDRGGRAGRARALHPGDAALLHRSSTRRDPPRVPRRGAFAAK